MAPSLQHLELNGSGSGLQDSLYGVLQLHALISLQLTDIQLPCRASPETWQQLSALQHLELAGYWLQLQPTVLGHIPHLEKLCLDGVRLEAAGATSGTAVLQATLTQLRQLTWLQLKGMGNLSHVPVEAYAALTSNSNLRQLELKDTSLPADAWTHVFSTSTWLPAWRPCV